MTDIKKLVQGASFALSTYEKIRGEKFRMKKSTKIALAAAAAVGLCVAVPVALCAPGIASEDKKAPFLKVNYAHRGLHSEDKTVPENSLTAFRLAVEAGYGIELDVQLSRDGKVVVFHDDTLDRVCGVHARVDDLTWEELCELRLCGTQERIPLFTEVLELVGNRSPIICELKTGHHNDELCARTYELIKWYGGNVCIESFDPTIVAWFRFHGSDLIRGQLAQPQECYNGEGVSPALAFVLSNTMLNVAARPHFIAYRIGPKAAGAKLSELLGAMKFCWTSHNIVNEAGNDGVIFEFYKPEPYLS